MKLTSIVSVSLLAAVASAKSVACRVNGKQGAVVDLETGKCPFEIPESVPVNFNFKGADDYLVDAYYVLSGEKFFNDIEKAGRIIEVAAKDLFETGIFNLFHIHLHETPASNSTASMRKRFNSKVMTKRDEESDLVAYIKSLSGTSLSSVSLEVSEPDASSSSASDETESAATTESSVTSAAEGSATTTTELETTLITITSCSDNKCSATQVPAVLAPTTVVVDDETTIYSTWCPLTSEATATTTTKYETSVVTITSCSEDKCSATPMSVVLAPTTVVVGGETSVYTTWTPLTSTESTTAEGATTEGTTTESEASSTGGAAGARNGNGVAVVSQAADVSQSTVAAESTAPAVSTLFNGAGKVGASLFAAIALPVAYLL